ncbi:tetratricopeptide repeat protein [Armatimonas rosea]|uniref:Tetratricopeptide (TPR) repeat protein n=1 Tax=Armatimonas rosea TaxID=685828 RepID=A0A7W9W8I8_ARMRO|nr:tetratricopeptide repeat protein [Armatimonas rosea]MBB6052818.1 tetratricopeptide (TPR) repeat protein [Armatimonas rosea]
MNCPGCRARNPIGNKFCRECGQKIPLEENTLAQEEALKAEAERARERVAQLLTRAFTLSQQGKPAEALPLAEEAAELLPSSTSALTLCSTLYERLGKNDQAIAMMEKVVALNPESTVDVDKLDRLKRGVHLLPARPTIAAAEESDDDGRRRWLPIAFAVGAGALVLTLGGIALVKSQDKKDPAPLAVQEVVATPTPALLPGARSTIAGGVAQGGAGPLSPPTVEARSDPFAPIGRVPMGATPEPQRNPMRASGPRAGRPEGGVALPNPREAFSREPQGQTVLGVPPVSLPSAPGGTGIRNPQLPALGGIQRNPDAIPAGPPTSPQGQGIPAGRPTGAEPPAESGGSGGSYIRVREHQGGGGTGNTGGSGENQTSSRSGDPLLRAQTLQVAGRYREAITTYREALSAGAPAGDVQQGIALCHQRLGEKAPARSAYQQAITAFEAQVRAGRSIDLASRGIAACRAALDVLGS